MRKTKLFLKGFRHGFKSFGMIITNIINTILLSIIYFVGIGTAALITRITRQKLMRLEKQRIISCYKHNKNEKETIKDYYKQF